MRRFRLIPRPPRNNKSRHNWLAVSGIGILIVFLSLWLPWMFVPAEVAIEREGIQDLISPGWKELSRPLAVMETGIWGAVDVGMLIPSWIFISLIVASGILSIITISRIFEVSFWIFFLPLILSIVFLTYWAGSSLALGCSLGAGFPFAAIGSAMIIFVAIKNKQMENRGPGNS